MATIYLSGTEVYREDKYRERLCFWKPDNLQVKEIRSNSNNQAALKVVHRPMARAAHVEEYRDVLEERARIELIKLKWVSSLATEDSKKTTGPMKS